MKFADLGLPETICTLLSRGGITEPTPVQNKAIPHVIAGKDLIGTAQTGTGKTLAFVLPIIKKFMENKNDNALILVPTRELANQVNAVWQPLLKAQSMAPACIIIGGVSMNPQISNLKRNPRVIIATPGRLMDHLQSRRLKLNAFKILVLDEADRMLDMGFMPQVRSILRHLPQERQTLLFTATLPKNLRKIINEILKSPEQVFVDPPSSANKLIEQKMIEVHQDAKKDALIKAIDNKVESVLVFARTKRRTDRIATFLTNAGVRTERIHGDRSQAQREKAIAAFRNRKVKVLVATDIASRGLDIPLVELVVNFDLPEQREDYIHRIGRTGRRGEKGEALSFVTPQEKQAWAVLSRPEKRTNHVTTI